jgi:hypothetical protein
MRGTNWRMAGLGAAVLVSGALTLAAGAPALAAPAPAAATSYTFHKLNNANDPTFNQLLGINNHGTIAGYFGSGAKGHPNKGYVLRPPYMQVNYRNENFPHSKQTQVTGLNDNGITVGFFSTHNHANLVNNNFGFYAVNGRQFHEVNFPAASPAKPPVDQLLGVNDAGEAVGFYNDAQGNSHGYTYNVTSHTFGTVTVPGATSVTAAAINNHGGIAGFYTNAGGSTVGFLRHAGGGIVTLSFPGASMTQAFGVNDHGEVVGTYTDGSGSTATTFGFTWTQAGGFHSVSDPHGKGTTLVNGVNNAGDLVGFYTGSHGFTDGFLAIP